MIGSSRKGYHVQEQREENYTEDSSGNVSNKR